MREKNRPGTAGNAASAGISGKGWGSMRNAIEVFRKRKFLVLAFFLIIFLAMCGFNYTRNLHTASTVLKLLKV